jgi:hypothetical protein
MAVFRGGCSLEAIESVCSEGLSIDVLDGPASLVDKNLVQQKEARGAEPRFVMLEMIHEYARERLRASSEEVTRSAWPYRSRQEKRAGSSLFARIWPLLPYMKAMPGELETWDARVYS